MAVHTFLKSAFTSLASANVDSQVLRRDIEANGIIIVALEGGPNALRWADEAGDPLYSFGFVSTLPGPQLTELGVIVAAHTGPDVTQAAASRVFKRTVDPVATDDEASIEVFDVGDVWINTVEKTAFTLVDPTATSAVWEWNTFAGDARESEISDGLEIMSPQAHTADQVLVTEATGAALSDVEDLNIDVTTTNYTPGGTTIENHLTAIDGEVGTAQTHAANTANPHGVTAAQAGATPIAHATDTGNPHSVTVAQTGGDTAGTARPPTAHVSSHANSGGDELNVAGLSGLLADAQTPTTHSASHSDGAADEITVENLATASNDTTHVLSPDGAGGLTMRAEAAGPVFGTELNIAESPAVSISTSETFAEKVRIPSAGDITFPAGTYLLAVSYGWNHDSTNNDFEAEVRQNDVVIGQIHQEEPSDVAGAFASTGTDQKHYVTREFHIVLGAGDFHFDVRFRTNNAGDESAIWDAYMRIWRLS